MGRNLIKKLFEFLRSLIQFIKIVILFFVMMLLLYWAQNLIGSNWSWLSPLKPFLDTVIAIGALFNNNSIDAWGAVFEFKYFIALIIMIIAYFVMNLVDVLTCKIEELTIDAHTLTNKIKEEHLNYTLEKQNIDEQKKINKYQVYITTSIKKKFSHVELNVNLDEQNIIMNKFLIEKLSVSPTKLNEGFLYSFSSFNDIDRVIEVLMKLIKSSAPLNYYISVQIQTGIHQATDISKILQLDSLKLENKICMNSDTAFRYRYNNAHRYGISQIGLFQKGNDTIEVSEFVEIL